MSTVRDITTVPKGERLYLHRGETHSVGTFVTYSDGVAVLDHVETVSHTTLAGVDPFITDLDGEVLGEPEPALVTIPPELE